VGELKRVWACQSEFGRVRSSLGERVCASQSEFLRVEATLGEFGRVGANLGEIERNQRS